MQMPYIFHFTRLESVLESFSPPRLGQDSTAIPAPNFTLGNMAPEES